MKEVVIPRKMRIRINKMFPIYWHYELLEEKCTKYLVVYKCLETGCIESWRKLDFLKQDKPKIEYLTSYERRHK